jgi:F-type H+-transporting ATPase subunit b
MQLIMPDIGLLFWMLVTFSIVLFILKKFAWKPILAMLQERDDSIEKALKAADKARESVEKLQAENARILDEAYTEREKIFRHTQAMKEKIIAEARQQASAEQQKIIAEARLAIEAEKSAAIKDIRGIAAELSVQVAEKLLRQELSTAAKQKTLIEKLISEIPVN